MFYTPYWLAVNNHFQALIYTFYENAHSKFKTLIVNYDREIFTLKDGG
jgi:hypothetical protein